MATPLLHIDGGTKANTLVGTFLAMVFNLTSGDILKTILLAAVGATVSFSLSMLLKWLKRVLKSKFGAKNEKDVG